MSVGVRVSGRWVVAVLVSSLLATLGLNAFFAPSALADTAAAAGEFVPVTPARVVDTRSSFGGVTGPVGALSTSTFTVTGGTSGVPTSGVSAVALTVTAVSPSVQSYLTVWSAGDARPAVAQMNTSAGVTLANTVISKVSATGQVSVFNYAGTVQLVIDVTGYYTNNATTGAGGTFVALTPTRAYDSRSGGTPLGAGASRAIQVAGLGGVPTSGVSAVVVNLTGVGATATTVLKAWGTGTVPGTQVVNINIGGTAGAMVQSGLDSSGHLNVYNMSGSIDVIVDVEGYYLTPAADAANYFVPITPVRVFSTPQGINTGTTPIAAGGSATVPIRGAKVGSTQVVPSDANITAVVVTLAVAAPSGAGNLGAYPSGVSRPNTSVVNYVTSDVTGTAIVKLGASGAISVYSSAVAGLRVDVQGYFQSSPPPAPPAPSISSTAYPSAGWAASGTAGSVTASVTGVSGPAVRKYLWSLDDPTLSTPKTVTVASDNAPGTFALSPAPTDGWHTLSVQALNTAGNVSPVSTYSSVPVSRSPHQGPGRG